MIIYPQKITIKWGSVNKKFYINKGYIFTKMKDEFDVDIRDLPITSNLFIKCKCDYCGCEYNGKYCNAINTKRFACNNCKGKKLKDCFKDKYGVSSALQVEEFKEKTKQTCLKKYGVENVYQSSEIKDKIKKNNIEKYGVEYSSQRKDVREKIVNTLIERYGVDNYSKTDEFKTKSKTTFLNNYGVSNPMKSDVIKNKVYDTNIKKYGVQYYKLKYKKLKVTMKTRYNVEHPFEIPGVKDKALKKMMKTFHENGTAPCSKQQKLIHELVGGELNYPVDKCMLDIAFPNEMIYIEYDGGGHDLSVKLGTYTCDEFEKKEMRRQYYLNSLGWKLIRIKCKNDKLPSNEKIVNEISNAKEYLNNNHNWIIIEF